MTFPTNNPQPPRLSPEEMAQVQAYIEKSDPELWHTCYPRIYSEPSCGRYYSPKLMAQQLFGITMKIRDGLVGSSEKYEFLAASHLAKYRVPMFWLSPDIAQAIRKTVPPQEIDWYNMPMPFEASCFMLPKGALVHPIEGEVAFVAYARFRAGEQYSSPLIKGFPYGSINGGMTFLALTVQGGSLLHWNLPLDAFGPHMRIPDIEAAVMKYAGVGHEHTTKAAFFNNCKMTDEDNHLLAEVAQYVFGSILLMNARPDLVTTGERRKVVEKRGERKEFWSPNVLGEHYKIRHESEPQGGHHASPRLHWVRGAYKQQPYGPGLELRKTLWIEPYVRGVDD